MQKFLIIAFGLFAFISQLSAQQDTIIVDRIVARVGDEIILQSDVETSYYQWLASGNYASRQAKCNILEDLLVQKLLLNQAKIDSLTVSDDELQMQVDARVNLFVQQMGGVDQLERYLNKTIFDIKEELKDVLKDQLIAEKERSKITADIELTPADVADYYKSLPEDSLPLVDVSYEIRMIVIKPELTPEEEKITIDKLKEIREKIVSGQRKFESMARIYSDDPVSARQGGELGFMSRAELDPDFAAVAFSLDSGEVSGIVKTQFGYHIIQMISRRGERVNVRHILIKPYVTPRAQKAAVLKADSVRQLILDDSLTFAEAAIEYSDDKATAKNGGLLFNPATGNTRFTMDELPPYIKYDLKDLEEGQISKPVVGVDEKQQTVIRLYKIEKKIPEHRANLDYDYQLIYDKALQHKKNEVFEEWVREQQKQVYISVVKDFADCKFKFKDWIK